MRDPYRALAPMYDAMAASADIQAYYGEWRTALLSAAAQRGLRLRVLVDLACGTGNSTIPWIRRRGLTVIGVDRSEAMLAVARRKSASVRWVHQDITRLRLEALADAVTCHFDAMNHLLSVDALAQACTAVSRLLRPGGLFQFDLNTIHMLRWLNGREKLFFVGAHTFTATNTLDEASGIATFRQVWFVRHGRLYARRDVCVQERSFTDAEVKGSLTLAGMRLEAVAVQRAIGRKPIRKLFLARKK